MKNISGKRIAVLTDHGFEEVELASPKKHWKLQGATAHIVSPPKGVKKLVRKKTGA